jgi:hypothetical protein
MSLAIDLPPEVERRVREEAARKGLAPEELIRSLVAERFRTDSESAQRVAALLDRWDAEDDARPEPGPVIIASPASLRVPDLG